MTKEQIGSILKELRIRSGKTQREVAELLGRKQPIVGHWETGYAQPDANTLFTLCDIYGTTIDEAFGVKKGCDYYKKRHRLLAKISQSQYARQRNSRYYTRSGNRQDKSLERKAEKLLNSALGDEATWRLKAERKEG